MPFGWNNAGQGALRRLLGMMAPEKRLISLGMLMLLISSLANLAVPAVAGSIVGAISRAQFAGPSRAKSASRSLRRALLTP